MRALAACLLLAACACEDGSPSASASKADGAALPPVVAVVEGRDEMAKRRARAEELRRQAVATGADFASLARAHSDDEGTRERGGDLGLFARDTHTRALDEAAFALKAGERSRVVTTEYGFHIIRVAARERARTLTLDEATTEIRPRLFAPREAEPLSDWLQ